MLAALSVATLAFGARLLWRPSESPILLFVFGYQWLEASTSVFHCNWLGKDVGDYSKVHGDAALAIVLSLLGLAAMAAGMAFALGPRGMSLGAPARSIALAQPAERWFHLYAASLAASLSALSVAYVAPGLTQPIIAAANIKWAFFYMLAYAYFCGAPGAQRYFIIAFLIELAQGVGGFFSDFKTVIFVSLFATIASNKRFSASAIAAALAFCVLGFALAVVWTVIKPEFRFFVSGGTGTQVVAVDLERRFAFLFSLIAKLDADALAGGVDLLLRRISYVEYFGAVLDFVPAHLPHEGGALWWDAISRPFMPRLLFPDKEVISDTLRTNIYTGGAAGESPNTSISIGAIGESYIDFGMFLMMPALFLLGSFYGAVYRKLIAWRAASPLLGMAIATAILLGAADLGASVTKTFGGVVVALLVGWIFVVHIAPHVAPWLKAKSR
ncbi:hypothetical protein A8B73_03705 [Methylosinus sp. 3S-1]|nr:hypothetical protein A8B73_03705 [Methylosinus sp. 3S-1]